MNRSVYGVLLGGCTGLLWALVTPASKLIAEAGVHMSTAVFFRMLLVPPIVWMWLRLRHPSELHVPGRDMFKIALLSLLAPTSIYLGFMLSVVYLNAATALVLHYTFPIVTVLGSSAVTGERPARSDIAGVMLVAAGVACSVMRPDFTIDTAVDVRGLLWGALAVVGLAGQTLLGRASVTKGGSGSINASAFAMFCYSHVFGILWIFLYKSAFVGWDDIALLTPYTLSMILGTVFVSCLLGYSCFFKALEFVSAPTASMMASLEIFGAVMMSWAFAGEVPTMPQITGCALIFCGIAVKTFFSDKG